MGKKSSIMGIHLYPLNFFESVSQREKTNPIQNTKFNGLKIKEWQFGLQSPPLRLVQLLG